MRVLLAGDPVPWCCWEGGHATDRGFERIQLSRVERSDGAESLIALMNRAGETVEVERAVLDAAGAPVQGGSTRWRCRIARVCPARFDSNSRAAAVESVLLEPLAVEIGDERGPRRCPAL